MQQDPSDYATHEWAVFAQTGSIYDYLSYKTRQSRAPGGKGESDADRNDRPGSSPGQSGRGRSDPDPSDT